MSVLRSLSLLLAAVVLGACSSREPAGSSPSVPASAADIERGRYLALAADCVGCHSAPGGREYAGGRAFRLAMGTLYSPNITPDRATGIGAWSDAEFVRAMQQGVGPDGQHYYPAFPYNYYTRLTREDVLAIKAYLFSLPAVSARAPQSQLRFPYDQRWLMVFWNALYNPNKRFAPDPAASAQVNRGAYLAEALGHCGVCHTPINFLQGPKRSQALGGETLAGWHAYNISSSPDYGIGRWSESDLIDYLGTGHAQGHGSAAGPMAEVIRYSTSGLTHEDLAALAAYLKSTNPVQGDGIAAAPALAGGAGANTSAAPQGEAATHPGAALYSGSCLGCHGWDGKGAFAQASLVGVRALRDPHATNLIQVVLHGSHPDGGGARLSMPAFGSSYSDSEVAALAEFTTGRFGTPARIKAQEVRSLRQF